MLVIIICAICIGTAAISAEVPDQNLGHQVRPSTLTAIFDMAGVRGAVHFMPTLDDDASNTVVIWARLTAPGHEGESLRWHVAENPLDTGTSDDACNAKSLGRSIVDMSGRYGNLEIGKEVTLSASGKVIRAERIFERTLVIRGIRSNLRACASIRSSRKVFTYEARFRSVVAGTIVLRHIAGLSVTGVRSELYWTRGNRRMRTPELKWALMVAPVGSSDDCSDLKTKVQQSSGTSSNRLMMARNPLPAGGRVTVTRARAKKYVIENRWPSLEDYEGLWVILYSWDVHVRGAAVVACSPVYHLLPTSASAAFPASVSSDVGVTGVVHFTQISPYGDPTTVTVDLALPGNAVGFGIDDLPTSTSPLTSTHCLHKLSLTYFNPLNAETDVAPAPLQATSDRYPVGDLGGRILGPLSNLTHLRTTYDDHYLMVSGTRSALGRMLVIYDKHWYPLSCAPLDFEYDPKTVTAEAVFDGPVKGQVRFIRRTSDPLAETAIRVDLRHTETGNASANHIWSIHERWSSDEEELSVDECFDPGNTYNPLKVESSEMYDCECHQDTPMRCKSGDLQGKLGPIRLGGAIVEEDHLADVSHVQLLFDQTSFLDGKLSIVGKLLVVRAPDFTEDIMACAIITNVY